MSNQPDQLTLVSFDLCPYVQRAAIVLAEKGVPYRRVDVDLADKPEWLEAISPLGKVPLLKMGDTVLFESGPIVEYLDEVHRPQLHPHDPLARARHRGWMELGSALLSDIWTLETTPDAKAFAAAETAARLKLGRIDAALGDGEFFAGDQFTLVDAVWAPVFRYLDAFERLAGLDLAAGLQKVAGWRKALAQRPSVKKAVAADYPARLEAFLRRQPSHLASLLMPARSAA